MRSNISRTIETTRTASRGLRPWLVTLAICLVTPQLVLAFSGGITSNSFPIAADACNFCHAGGTPPVVELLGPTAVAPSSTNEYTFRIFEVGLQHHGGLNASIPLGTLATGGAFASDTQAALNTMSGLLEITHTTPKMAAGGMVEFSFLWTAPASFTNETLQVWGNAVELNSSTGGDRATKATLLIVNNALSTPTATASATPTATPIDPCAGDIAPRDPAPIADGDLRKCQETLSKAAGLYVKKKMKAVQKCMNGYQKGKITGPDPVTVCRGTLIGMVPTLPTDQKTADKITKAEIKLGELLANKCTDVLVAQLDTCATTVADLETCTINDHWQVIDGLIETQYGNLFASPDSGEQKCQKTIGNEGFKFVTKSLKASQKCLDKRNKTGAGGDGAALCIGSVTSGVYTLPTDAKTAEKVNKAETKLRDKIATKCDALLLAGLDSCALDPTSESDCLVCTHRSAFVSLLDTEYGGN